MKEKPDISPRYKWMLALAALLSAAITVTYQWLEYRLERQHSP